MEVLKMLLEAEFYYQFVEGLGPFGFLAGILLAMIEAFIPPLPLAAFVTINVITFGFFEGYILSYIGTVIGAYCMFLLFGKFGKNFIHNYTNKHTKAKSILLWIHDKGVFPIIVLMTFPFTPSVFVSGMAAFAGVKKRDYLFALTIGKLFMVFSLSFIGVNVKAFFTQPIKSIILITLTLGISLVAKKIMSLYERKVLRSKIEQDKIKRILVGDLQ